jgi:hypothetical protein
MTLTAILENLSDRSEFLSSLSNAERIKVSSLIERLNTLTTERAKLFGKLGKSNKAKFEALKSQSKETRIQLELIINNQK